MGNRNSKDSAKLSTETALTEYNKRWLVFGIALNHVLVPSIRSMLEQEIHKEYNYLKTKYSIDVQTSHCFPVSRYPNAMKYENINANDAKLKPPHYKKLDYSKFDYQVASHVDFAKLFLQNHMTKFNAFDETCDASAVLNLFGRIPVFSLVLQKAADVVREGRNAWGHCNFNDWSEANFKTRFDDMELLVKEMRFSSADETKILTDLRNWRDKGFILCMSATIDRELVKVIQEHVSQLSGEVEKMAFDTHEELNNLKMLFKNIELCLHKWTDRLTKIELEQEVLHQEQCCIAAKLDRLTTNQDVLQQEQSSAAVKVDQLTINQEVLQQEQSSTAVKVDQLTTNQEVLQQEQSSTAVKVDKLKTDQEVLQQEQSSTAVKMDQLEIGQKAVEKRVIDLECQTSSLDFSSCEADINYYTERYDPNTRQWLLNDFDAWFNKPSESRAYILLGDAGVGKSVMAAVIAQRARDDGNLAVAYFSRHYDGTRRDPRYLLGTIAHQLRNCNSEYHRVVGGDTGILRMLANDKLGVHELFTKLLEEPLSKCGSCKRKLVVIDALDETEYWSRQDFLALVMNRFPQLPKWLVFFITSRPEDTVQFRLKTYNPCIRICAGSSESVDFYQQHEQDIQRFLERKIDFSTLSYPSEHVVKLCKGLFLYAFYCVESLTNRTQVDGYIIPPNIYAYFYDNFTRIYNKVGAEFCKKLFGCAIVAPFPLPVSFISFLWRKENSTMKEKEVIDAVSLFVLWRTSDKTFTFLHNLIPDWLTDEEKARELFVDRNKANDYFREINVEFLNSYLKEQKEFSPCDIRNYVLGNGIRFLCNCSPESSDSSEIIFNCLKYYRFLQHRIRSKTGIFSLIRDFRFSLARQSFSKDQKSILGDICSAIEQEKYVIAGNPELLYSCLQNATKPCSENIYGNESSSWMEIELDLGFSVKNEVPIDMTCGAFSHDKKLFAGGKDRCIYVYDTSTFRKILGPFEVTSGYIPHLEFSPNDKFVFFGRLDAWFSVEEELVVEKTPFKGISECYDWGSFFNDGNYIAVVRKNLTRKHTNSCLMHLFSKWILTEFDLGELNTREREYRKFLSFGSTHWCLPWEDGEELKRHLWYLARNMKTKLCSRCAKFDMKTKLWSRCAEFDMKTKLCSRCAEIDMKTKLCSRCAEFEDLRTPVRDCIVLLYAEIFEYQIWNVQTGRPVIEEMFSSQVKLKPFFYLWHIFAVVDDYVVDICAKNIAVGYIAVLHFLLVHGQLLWPRRGTISTLSFTSDSNTLIYIIRSKDQETTVCALSIDTGTRLHSISGLYPRNLESGDGHAAEYIFFGTDEKRTVLLRDLPWSFLRCITRNHAGRINVAFTSTDRIMLICSNAMYTVLEVTDGTCVTAREYLLNVNSSQQIHVKKCVFSNDGNLIAVHESCEILLFKDSIFLCSVFKLEEKCDHTITWMVFSPDNCLLSFVIKKGTDIVPSVHVWDVKKRLLFGPISIPCIVTVDCCCFSSDNTKLILCNASYVVVLEDPPKFARDSWFYNVPKFINGTSQVCAHCTVSSDDKLLACCVANEILIFPFNGQDTYWKIPHTHLGKIKFCKFLKGNRYLMSCDIDSIVVLFDISERKSIAYARLWGSVISIAVSPDENNVVCLTSSGNVSMLKLCGLKSGLPSNFQLPSTSGLPERSFEAIRSQTTTRQIVSEDMELVITPEEFCGNSSESEPDELSYSYFNESSDDDASDVMHSDKI